MDIFHIAVVALCAVVLAALLKKVSSEQGILLSTAAVVLILLLVLESAAPLVTQLQSLMDANLLDDLYIGVLIKALGITIIAQVTEKICKDCGESGLAYSVSIAARTAILLLTLPIISQIFTYLSEILERSL